MDRIWILASKIINSHSPKKQHFLIELALSTLFWYFFPPLGFHSGCLCQYEAFLFQKNFPIYTPFLYHQALSTIKSLLLCTNTPLHPSSFWSQELNWKETLKPYSFTEIFGSQTREDVLHQARPSRFHNNYWFSHAPPHHPRLSHLQPWDWRWWRWWQCRCGLLSWPF